MNKVERHECGCVFYWRKGAYQGARYRWEKMTTCEEHRDKSRKEMRHDTDRNGQEGREVMATWMNEYEIDMFETRFQYHPTLGPAARTLGKYVDVINRNSDGWPYWEAGGRAAGQLMGILAEARVMDRSLLGLGTYWETDGATRIRKAYGPMKSLLTRRLPHVDQKAVFES